jgi:hypothetical protein
LLVAPGENPVQLFAQSCPSSGVCVGSDGAGRILTSTNPAGGAAAWSSAVVDPNGGGIFNLACASTTACVAFDDNGSVLTSTNPAGGASTWSTPSSSIDANGIFNLSCPSATVCVATDLNGDVLTSSTPPFTAASWSSPASIENDSYISALACPPSGTCVGIDADGHVYTSSTPPFAAATWTGFASSIDPSTIYEIACPSSTACIAIDSQGHVLTATAPFAAANWSTPSSSSIDPNNTITQLACPTSNLCIATDDNGNVLGSTTAPFSATAWSTSNVDAPSVITGLACTRGILCAIGDEAGNVLVGNPTLPLNTSPPAITGNATVGQTLAGSHGSWTSNPTSYSDQWQDCDAAESSCTTIAGATGTSYTLKQTDAGHTIRLVEAASNPSGTGQPANSAPTAVVVANPKPACSIRAKSSKVLLPPASGRKAHSRKTQTKPGTVSFVVRCDQAADVTLRSKLTELINPKHGKKHGKTSGLPVVHGTAQPQRSLVLTINLPAAALTALRAKAHEALVVTLTGANANGISTTTATISKLKPLTRS